MCGGQKTAWFSSPLLYDFPAQNSSCQACTLTPLPFESDLWLWSYFFLQPSPLFLLKIYEVTLYIGYCKWDHSLQKTQPMQCPYISGCYKQVATLKGLDQGYYIYPQMEEIRFEPNSVQTKASMLPTRLYHFQKKLFSTIYIVIL